MKSPFSYAGTSLSLSLTHFLTYTGLYEDKRGGGFSLTGFTGTCWRGSKRISCYRQRVGLDEMTLCIPSDSVILWFNKNEIALWALPSVPWTDVTAKPLSQYAHLHNGTKTPHRLECQSVINTRRWHDKNAKIRKQAGSCFSSELLFRNDCLLLTCTPWHAFGSRQAWCDTISSPFRT